VSPVPLPALRFRLKTVRRPILIVVYQSKRIPTGEWRGTCWKLNYLSTPCVSVLVRKA
jgi:hypothetical protein